MARARRRAGQQRRHLRAGRASTATSQAWKESWERTLAICLVSPAALCRAAIHSFRQQRGGGIIVNLASRAAHRGEDPDYWHYAAAKAGVVAMTKTIARQYGRQGVTAFAISPGFVDTAFNTPLVEEHGIDLFVNDTALGEVAQPQDIANVIAFLASGKARHATGTTVDVNSAELRPLTPADRRRTIVCRFRARTQRRRAHVARSVCFRAPSVLGSDPRNGVSGVRPQP